MAACVVRVLVVLWVVTLSVTAFGSELPARCRDLGAKELKALPRDGVFFASWCRSCLPSLLQVKSGQAVIAVFDDQQAAEQVVNALSLPRDVACYIDSQGLAIEHFKIRELPARWQQGQLVPAS